MKDLSKPRNIVYKKIEEHSYVVHDVIPAIDGLDFLYKLDLIV
jgi:hypothetical protein